ncbi:hypothetical protein TWF694_004894 [Orbilia ellipsospora]|uniref:Uncharacterized protein n=1 Tax=Orbilia ellipsospora TaxID=2528407 RepID=A0AAV9WVJ4_9PEZI
MLPLPFKSSDVSIKKDDDNKLVSTLDTMSLQDPSEGVKVVPIVKTSRFSSLFPQNNALAGTSHKAMEDFQHENQAQDVPRYKAPKIGQGIKAPTPPAAYSDPNPKRLYLDNIPYAARKPDVLKFFDGYNVECIDFPKKRDGLKGVVYVNVATEEEAKRAVQELNGENLKGRRVRVMHAKVSGAYRKSQPDLAAAYDLENMQNMQPSISSDASSASGPIPQPALQVSCGPNQDMEKKPNLREGIFQLACQTLSRGERTPEDIFREINFTEDEKAMLEEFYYRYKLIESENTEQRRLIMEVISNKVPCIAHGSEECQQCQQSMVLNQLRDEEQKENILFEASKPPGHQHTISWDSGISMRSQINPDYQPQRSTSTMISRQNSAPQGAVYPPLTAGAALRLYGPKYVKENFPQSQPPIRDTYIPLHGGLSLPNPFQRQNSVVSTQPGIKTHCAYFLRTGHCDFAQQGCKFSHELPPGGPAELSGPPSTRLAIPPPGFVGPPPRAMYTEPLVPVPRMSTLGPGHMSGPMRSVSGPSRSSLRRLEEMYQPMVPTLGGIDISYPHYNPRPTFDGGRHRSMSQITQHQRSIPKLWRESNNWRDSAKRSDSRLGDTDGAADDEESDSDLISLSSYN